MRGPEGAPAFPRSSAGLKARQRDSGVDGPDRGQLSLGSRSTRGLVLGGAGEEVACGGRVPDGGFVADAEHGGEVERVWAGGECLVELAVDAELLEGDAEAPEGAREPVLADRAGGHGGLVVDEQVGAGGLRPALAPPGEPFGDELAGQVVQRAGLAGDG